tara:strand:- start:11259 stop:11864 length:606 start_codon:yes stop_codon:yes gene_type:complete
LFIKPLAFFRFFYPSLIWKKQGTKKIWLTFDDGPTPEVTEHILSVLKSEKILATFFLVGKDISNNLPLYEKIKTDGHTVGNHTNSHLNGWKTSTKKYIQDIEKCQKLMANNKLFRPPYGKITSRQIFKLKKKYKLILWDILSYDFKEKNSYNLKRNVLDNISDGSIIVFHNNLKSYTLLKETLKDIIIELKKLGYSFSSSW